MKLKRWTMNHTKGVLLGIITPLILAPLVLWVISLTQSYYFEQLWHKFTLNRPYQIKIITIAIIANLGWFYLFLNKEKFDIAKGVILGTVLFAPYIIYIKFF
ncbi:MAG: hypothetical protein COA33_001320 [Fluviicola sp.]|nr:hypothetical protein [Fluviicola sp.]